MPTRWQHFPRSQKIPAHLLEVVKVFQACETEFAQRYTSWDAWVQNPVRGGQAPRMESNQVLSLVAPGLMSAGYSVETGGKLPVVVLWGENGRDAKKYFADAKLEHAEGRETVIEVEAGGATANNAWRKDFMEACLMPYVDYLCIAVRIEYRSLNRAKGTIRVNQDFQTVTAELDALYESHRLPVPLLGITVIGY